MVNSSVKVAEFSSHIRLARFEIGALVIVAAEFFHFADRVIGDGAHDSAGLKASFFLNAVMLYLEFRGPAFAADFVELLIDNIVGVSLLFKIHCA